MIESEMLKFEGLLRDLSATKDKLEFKELYTIYFGGNEEKAVGFMEKVAQFIKQSGSSNAKRRSWRNDLKDFDKFGFEKLMDFGPEFFVKTINSAGRSVVDLYIPFPEPNPNLVDPAPKRIPLSRDRSFRKANGSTSKSGILDSFQKELNPKLWSSATSDPIMNQDFRFAVQKVAETFVNKHGFTLRGQLFYGGNAGYQYGPKSDADFSLYVDWDEKSDLIPQHEILAKELKEDFLDYEGIECHFFLKSPEERDLVEANENVYNVTTNKWIQKPTRYDFDPKDELADEIVNGEEFKNKMQMNFDKACEELKEMSELGMSEIPKESLSMFKPLIGIVKQLRTNRDIEHRKVREKAIAGEEVTFFDRATQNEIAWKMIDSTPMLKKLDEIKKLLK